MLVNWVWTNTFDLVVPSAGWEPPARTEKNIGLLKGRPLKAKERGLKFSHLGKFFVLLPREQKKKQLFNSFYKCGSHFLVYSLEWTKKKNPKTHVQEKMWGWGREWGAVWCQWGSAHWAGGLLQDSWRAHQPTALYDSCTSRTQTHSSSWTQLTQQIGLLSFYKESVCKHWRQPATQGNVPIRYQPVGELLYTRKKIWFRK